MALMKCPDCKKKISDTVDACPNCGCKITDEQRGIAMKEAQRKSNVPIIAMVIGIIVCIAFIFSLFIIHGMQAKKEEEKQRYDILYEEFNCWFDDYAQVVESYCIDYEKITDYEKSVWYNCLWKISDEKTNSFTVNEKGRFYKNFNNALEKWRSSADYYVLEQNVEYSMEKENNLYKKMKGCELDKKDVKDKQELVKSIHELLKDAVYFNEDGGYSYEEYNEKTKDYMDQVRRKLNDMKKEF